MTGNRRPLTQGEEIANSVTHGIGAALSVAGLVAIVVAAARHRPAWQIAACAIYGARLVLLYTSSTIYHALANNRAKRVFKILDHASIYLLIAGTYTPFTLVSLRGRVGWVLFAVVWALAIAGVIFKSMATGRFAVLSAVVYLFQGWLVVFAGRAVLHAIGWSGCA